MDDEASLRVICREVLQASGYTVVTATDGADAIVQYAQRKDEIAAILTDMVMPVMDGAALIMALRRLNSVVPIVATSGLSNPEQQLKVTAAGTTHFLAKPYTTESLLNSLHEALGRH